MADTQLPRQINILRAADQGLQFSGKLLLADMARLTSSLLVNEGEVDVSLAFGKDEAGYRFIRGKLDCLVQMQCQRCSEPMTVELNENFTLSPVLSDGQARSVPSEYEPLMVDIEDQELLPIIEDELILQLPIVAKHDNDNCHAAEPAAANKNETLKVNPFAEQLSKLKFKE